MATTRWCVRATYGILGYFTSAHNVVSSWLCHPTPSSNFQSKPTASNVCMALWLFWETWRVKNSRGLAFVPCLIRIEVAPCKRLLTGLISQVCFPFCMLFLAWLTQQLLRKRGWCSFLVLPYASATPSQYKWTQLKNLKCNVQIEFKWEKWTRGLLVSASQLATRTSGLKR